MAYDSLKALIRQYIKTNGEQEITGQILQNVLVEMVNQYPSTDGYATQSWVTSQLAGYATTSQLADYLPLTGGTMTGGIASGSLDTGYYFLSNELMRFEYSYNGSPRYAGGIEINVKNGTVTWYGRGGQWTGTEITGGSVTSGSFIVQNGTSSQFLKADGSVDSNAYLPKQGSSFYFITDADMPETAANINTLNAAHRMTLYRNAILMPYQMNDANDGGFIRSRGTSESSAIMEIGMWDDSGAGETIQFNYYPTTSTINPTYTVTVPKKSGTIALTSDLSGYLPLTGGTMTGGIASGSLDTGYYFLSNELMKFEYSYNGSPQYAGGIDINVKNRTITWYGRGGQSTGTEITGGSVTSGSFIVQNGTSDLFLKADGSLDGNTYVTASALSGYLPLTGGTLTGNLTVNGNNGINFGTDDDVYIKREYSRLLIINEAGNDIIIGDYDNRKFTSIVNDLQGGTTDSTYRSVTQKWLIRHDGDAYFKSVSQTSDLRKKTITGDVPMNLYNVANAPLFKFTWNNETKYSGQHIGSAAQYWQTVLPELVSIGRDADMTLAMQYDVIALASAITVAKTVVNHEERIILLERENEALKKEIAALKSA